MKNNRPLYHNINAFVRRGVKYYVAECVEIGVVTQGKSIDETIENLKEAVALHLDNENPADFGLAPNPSLIVTMEVEPIASAV
jgi:predicted RNase H-like HicB family nuclease